MNEVYFPFDSVEVNGEFDREYNSQDFADYFRKLVSNGVFLAGDNLKVSAGSGQSVNISSGSAYIEGRAYTLKETKNILLASPHASYSRIDTIVLRLDYKERSIGIYAVTGTAGASPTAKPLVRNADVYELVLAEVLVKKSATSIEASGITDKRLDRDVCGIVSHLIDSVDLTQFFTSYEEWLSEKKIEFRGMFLDWFNNLKTMLSDNQLTNLVYEIEKRALKRIKKNFSLASSEWVSDNTISLFTSKITVLDDDIDEEDSADVLFDIESIQHATDCSVSYVLVKNGMMSLFASSKPTNNLTGTYYITKGV